jgi:hypothetical protein
MSAPAPALVPAAAGGFLSLADGPRQHMPMAHFPGTDATPGRICAECEHFKPSSTAQLLHDRAERRAARERTLAALENRPADPGAIHVPPFENGRCAEAIRRRRSDRRAPPWDGGTAFIEKRGGNVDLTGEEWRKHYPDWWRTIAIYGGATPSCRHFKERSKK